MESLLATALSDAQIGVVGSKLLFADAPNMLQAVGGARFNPSIGSAKRIGFGEIVEGQQDREVILDYVSDATMFVGRTGKRIWYGYHRNAISTANGLALELRRG